MNVGLLTYHHTTNYGATLQCYALRQAIERLGHRCSTIDYRHPRAVAFYRRMDWLNRNAIKTVPRLLRFRRFMADELNMTERVRREGLAGLASRFDAIVVGSDQVFELGPPRGWSPEFFLDFVPNGSRRVAYAPSFGTTTLANIETERDAVATLLRRFDALSGRDQNSVTIASTLLDREVPVVLDPTFLGDFTSVTGPRPGGMVSSPYLLAYGLPSQRGLGERLRQFAHSRGWRLVSLASRSSGPDLTLNAAGPKTFLSLFRDASMVVTPFFHGTIFAILNRKPFVSFASASKAIKVTDLLGRFNLPERQAAPEDVDEGLLARLSAYDADAVEAAVAPLRDASLDYLRSSLA